MKRKSFIGVVALGALLVIFAGISQAGGVMHDMHKSSGVEKAVKQTTETASPEIGAGDFGEGGAPLEYWEALGTGSIPSSGVRSDLPDFDNDPLWSESGG